MNVRRALVAAAIVTACVPLLGAVPPELAVLMPGSHTSTTASKDGASTTSADVTSANRTSASGTSKVHPTVEAWYTAPLGCSLPTNCLPYAISLPSAAQPAGTLQVGQVLGQEIARTYLRFETKSTLVYRSGTLRLPIALDVGNSALGTPHPIACLASGQIVPNTGGTALPPEIDCSLVKIPLKLETTATGTELVGDLKPMIDFNEGDLHDFALAVVADTKAGAIIDTWTTSFTMSVAGTPEDQRISATLAGDASATPVFSEPDQDPSSEPVVEPVAGDLETPEDVVISTPIRGGEQAAGGTKPQRPVLAPVAQPRSASSGPADRYGVAWLLPLLFGGLMWLLSRTAGGDLRELSARQSRRLR